MALSLAVIHWWLQLQLLLPEHLLRQHQVQHMSHLILYMANWPTGQRLAVGLCILRCPSNPIDCWKERKKRIRKGKEKIWRERESRSCHKLSVGEKDRLQIGSRAIRTAKLLFFSPLSAKCLKLALSNCLDIPESSTRTFTHWHALTKRIKKNWNNTARCICPIERNPFFFSLFPRSSPSSQSSSYLRARLHAEGKRGKKILERASADRKKISSPGSQTTLSLYLLLLPPSSHTWRNIDT